MPLISPLLQPGDVLAPNQQEQELIERSLHLHQEGGEQQEQGQEEPCQTEEQRHHEDQSVSEGLSTTSQQEEESAQLLRQRQDALMEELIDTYRQPLLEKYQMERIKEEAREVERKERYDKGEQVQGRIPPTWKKNVKPKERKAHQLSIKSYKDRRNKKEREARRDIEIEATRMALRSELARRMLTSEIILATTAASAAVMSCQCGSTHFVQAGTSSGTTTCLVCSSCGLAVPPPVCAAVVGTSAVADNHNHHAAPAPALMRCARCKNEIVLRDDDLMNPDGTTLPVECNGCGAFVRLERLKNGDLKTRTEVTTFNIAVHSQEEEER